MIEIKNFEDLEFKKYYIAKLKSNANEYLICRIIKKDFVLPIYKYNIEIKENTFGWELKQMTISFSDFRKYTWYELTDDEAMVELL